MANRSAGVCLPGLPQLWVLEIRMANALQETRLDLVETSGLAKLH